MASFRKRGKTWQFTVEIGIDPVTGKRKQKTQSGFKTKKAAQLAASEIDKKVNDGTYIGESDITFGELVPIWLKYYNKYVRKGTMESRNTSVNKLNEYFRFIMMRKIKKTDYVSMLHNLQDRELSVNTIKSIHSTASLIFKYACYEIGIIKMNPTENVDMRFLKSAVLCENDGSLKDNEKFLEKEDLAEFLQIANSRNGENPQEYIVFLMLAYTGLRRGELSVLKWQDIDFQNQTISITKTFSYGDTKAGNDIQLISPKTPESKRVIDIDDFVIIQLKKHQSWLKQFMMENRKFYRDQDFIFVNTFKYLGYPIAPQTIYYHMTAILKKMEYPVKLSPHSMRHTHASLCIEAGIPLRDIAERLGHRDIKMLEKIYAHTTKGQKKKTAQMFNQLMSKVRKETPF
ncbi:site-specific integrase [Virgibacillus phasianinus]|nr:site-specific integrase [Virgibacillus phasianinus]